MKGHIVNECPKLGTTGRDKFLADRKASHKAKQGVVHAAVTLDASTPTPVPAPSVSSDTNTSTDFKDFKVSNTVRGYKGCGRRICQCR